MCICGGESWDEVIGDVRYGWVAENRGWKEGFLPHLQIITPDNSIEEGVSMAEMRS